MKSKVRIAYEKVKERIKKDFEENEFRICEGRCAKCDSEEIDYLGSDVEGIGKEWYSLTYLETR